MLGGPFIYKAVDTLLNCYSFNYSNATRDYLNQYMVKYIRAIHPNRFKMQCDAAQNGLHGWKLCWDF